MVQKISSHYMSPSTSKLHSRGKEEKGLFRSKPFLKSREPSPITSSAGCPPLKLWHPVQKIQTHGSDYSKSKATTGEGRKNTNQQQWSSHRAGAKRTRSLFKSMPVFIQSDLPSPYQGPDTLDTYTEDTVTNRTGAFPHEASILNKLYTRVWSFNEQICVR